MYQILAVKAREAIFIEMQERKSTRLGILLWSFFSLELFGRTVLLRNFFETLPSKRRACVVR